MNYCPPAQLNDTVLNQAIDCLEEAFPNCRQGKFFLQFGSGFAVEALFNSAPLCLPLSALPGMPGGHTPDQLQPQLLWGQCRDQDILVFQGHRHLCEGFGLYPCLLPTVAAWKLGLKQHLYIDSAISLLSELKIGHWVLLTDFLNGYSFSPLDGFFELLPSPYPDLSSALAQELNSELVNALDGVGISPKLCTYLAQPGFQICTVAEAASARQRGAEILGHDLVMEIITAHALGCRVAALVLVSGQHCGLGSPGIRRQEMLDTCRFCSADFLRGLGQALANIAGHPGPTLQAQLPDSVADELIQDSITFKSGKTHHLRSLLRPNSDKNKDHQ